MSCWLIFHKWSCWLTVNRLKLTESTVISEQERRCARCRIVQKRVIYV